MQQKTIKLDINLNKIRYVKFVFVERDKRSSVPFPLTTRSIYWTNRTPAHAFSFVFAKTVLLKQEPKCGAYTPLPYPRSHNIETLE